ncbi:glycosyltransferase family 4 protein [Mucilaginibacter sp. HD30]
MLFDIRMINSSGIGTYIRALLPAICQQFKTTLLTNDPDVLTGINNNFEILNFEAPIYSIKEQIKYITLPPVDILFSPHYNSPILPVRAKKRVVTIHDVYHLAYYSQLSYTQKLYANLAINRSVKLSDRIITVSDFSKTEIIKYTGCSPEKISVIHNGVKQLTTLRPLNHVRKKYGLPDKYLLYVGNVKPHKNLKIFLDAYLLLVNSIKDEYKIVIAGKKDGFITGDNSLFDFIDTNSELKHNVIFTGYVEDNDMDTLYSAASLLVFPSFYEGFGLPPLEAMLNNCPVISSNAASLPEVCGDAAIFFEPFDKEDLAFKIMKVLRNGRLRRDLVSKGALRVKKFAWEVSAQKHLQLLKDLL